MNGNLKPKLHNIKLYLQPLLLGLVTTCVATAWSVPVSAQSQSTTPTQPALNLSQEEFDNGKIQFSVDTIVEFEFIESHGAYQSTFGVINLATGEKTPLIQETKPSDLPESPIAPSTYQNDTGRPTDFLGTPGNAVPQPYAEFTFKANTPYMFYLESFFNGQSAGILYSINERNGDKKQRLRFDEPIENLAAGGIVLSWDDTGSSLVMTPEEDQDFDDFIVRAGGHIACPPDALQSCRPSQSQRLSLRF